MLLHQLRFQSIESLRLLWYFVSMYPESYLTSEEIRLVPKEPVRGGAAKIVYKVIYENEYYAAKIYRTNYYDGTNDPIDRQACAESEFQAYSLLLSSTLKPYIPLAVKLLKDQGKAIGLLVEWRDGEPLRSLLREIYLPNDLFDLLEQQLLSLPQNLCPDADIFNEYNLCYHQTTSLWLAECRLETDSEAISLFPERVKKTIAGLKQDYGRKS